MKISINVAEEKLTFLNLLNRNKVNKRRLPLKYNTQYPAFEEG